MPIHKIIRKHICSHRNLLGRSRWTCHQKLSVKHSLITGHAPHDDPGDLVVWRSNGDTVMCCQSRIYHGVKTRESFVKVIAMRRNWFCQNPAPVWPGIIHQGRSVTRHKWYFCHIKINILTPDNAITMLIFVIFP